MNKQVSRQVNVLIVGAGPVGLTMAYELTRQGIPCRIVDQSPASSATSRVLAIFPRTLEVFETMDMVNDIVAAGHQIHAISAFGTSRRIARLSVDDLDSSYPFVISLPQSHTERILIHHLASRGIHVERQVELTALTQDKAGVRATRRHADGHEETAGTGWLIGCDGAPSTVRHALQIPFEGAPYDEVFVLADVKIAGNSPATEVSLFLHEDGLLAIIPFGRGRYRVVADLPRDGQNQPSERPTLTEIQALVDTRGPARLRLTEATWLSRFHISHRKARHFRQGRVFLAGDAAHVHSPASGQGMNTEIQTEKRR